MTRKAKLCPFCQKPPHVSGVDRHIGEPWVTCLTDGCALDGVEDIRLSQWNTRAPDAHDELLAIHRITACIAEVEPVSPQDTLTVQQVKHMAQWINQDASTKDAEGRLAEKFCDNNCTWANHHPECKVLTKEHDNDK